MTTTSAAAGSISDARAAVARQLHERLLGLQQRARKHDPSALRPLAELRRAAGAPFGRTPGADAALLRLIRLPGAAAEGPPPLTRALGRLLDDALLVASLVALSRAPVRADRGARRGSLGADLRPLRAARESAAEGLVKSILGSVREDIAVPLRRALLLLGGDGHWVDVAALVRDLGAWDAEGQPVQRRWAYDFWADSAAAAHDHHQQEEESA